MYVASRGLFNLKPPTVFVPPCIKEDVEKLLDIHRTMGQVELNAEVVALDVGMFHLSFVNDQEISSRNDVQNFILGETYEIRNNLVVRPFKTQHVIPSQVSFDQHSVALVF